VNAIAFRIGALALWLGLLAAAFLTSPSAAPDTNDLIVKMMTGRLDGVNLSLFALFNLMGVWPIAMMVALRFDRPRWKWPFIAGSFALGAFVLLPYLVVRPYGGPRDQPASRLGSFLGNRLLWGALALVGAGLLVLFAVGDLSTFARLWRTEQFPYVMSLDFVAMTLARALLAVAERPMSAAARGARATG
jgi:hypothetical protein